MNIEYMKILLDYPVLYPEKDYPNSVVRIRNRGMSEAEIIAFKSYINNIRYNGVAGAPFNFQKALEEFLFLAGKHCFGLTNEHGVCAELLDYYFDLLNHYSISVSEPFVILESYSVNTYIVQLTDPSPDPIVYNLFWESVYDQTSQTWSEYVSEPISTDMTLSQFIEHRILLRVEHRDKSI